MKLLLLSALALTAATASAYPTSYFFAGQVNGNTAFGDTAFSIGTVPEQTSYTGSLTIGSAQFVSSTATEADYNIGASMTFIFATGPYTLSQNATAHVIHAPGGLDSVTIRAEGNTISGHNLSAFIALIQDGGGTLTGLSLPDPLPTQWNVRGFNVTESFTDQFGSHSGELKGSVTQFFPVPEPASLISLGVLSLAALRRRRPAC